MGYVSINGELDNQMYSDGKNDYVKIQIDYDNEIYINLTNKKATKKRPKETIQFQAMEESIVHSQIHHLLLRRTVMMRVIYIVTDLGLSMKKTIKNQVQLVILPTRIIVAVMLKQRIT